MSQGLVRHSETGSKMLFNPRVLVVDDEPLILEFVGLILESQGFSVSTAQSADQAIQLVQSSPGFALTILDWQLNGTSGEHVFDRIIYLRPDLRVIVVSGNDSAEVRRAFSGRRVERFLHKPFTPQVLVTTVRSTLEGSQATSPAT